MSNVFKKLLVIAVVLTMLIFTPLASRAVDISDVISDLDKTAQSAKIIEEPAEAATVYDIVGLIINVILTFLGVLFLLMMIYGGIIWMTAAGNQEKVKKAGSLISQGGLGLLIILFAFILTNFVIFKIIGATTGSQSPNTNEAVGVNEE